MFGCCVSGNDPGLGLKPIARRDNGHSMFKGVWNQQTIGRAARDRRHGKPMRWEELGRSSRFGNVDGAVSSCVISRKGIHRSLLRSWLGRIFLWHDPVIRTRSGILPQDCDRERNQDRSRKINGKNIGSTRQPWRAIVLTGKCVSRKRSASNLPLVINARGTPFSRFA